MLSLLPADGACHPPGRPRPGPAQRRARVEQHPGCEEVSGLGGRTLIWPWLTGHGPSPAQPSSCPRDQGAPLPGSHLSPAQRHQPPAGDCRLYTALHTPTHSSCHPHRSHTLMPTCPLGCPAGPALSESPAPAWASGNCAPCWGRPKALMTSAPTPCASLLVSHCLGG